MNEMQRFLVEDHIQGLEHEAERIRAERNRDRRSTESPPAQASTAGPNRGAALPLPAGAAFAAVPVTVEDGPSARVRLGRWLVGVGAAIAATNQDARVSGDAVVPGTMVATAATTAATVKASNGPCDDGPTTLSHAA